MQFILYCWRSSRSRVLTSNIRAFSISSSVSLRVKRTGKDKVGLPDQIIFSGSEYAVLIRNLLGIKNEDTARFALLAGKHGLYKTGDILLKARKLLATEGMTLNKFFKTAKRSRCDAVELAKVLIDVAKEYGNEKAFSTLRKRPLHLEFLSNYIPLKVCLAKHLNPYHVKPSRALINRMMEFKGNVPKKMRAFKRVVPIWCLKKLMEGRHISWYNNGAQLLRCQLMVLERSFLTVMSRKSAKEASIVCIARYPPIASNKRKDLECKVALLRHSIYGENFADFIIRRPKILGLDHLAATETRYRQFSVWMTTVFAGTKSIKAMPWEKFYLLYHNGYKRIIHRLKYAALYGGHILSYPLTYFVVELNQNFNSLHAEFQKWKSAFEDNDIDDQYVPQFDTSLDRIFSDIEVARFQSKLPLFTDALNKMIPRDAASKARFLLTFIGPTVLKQIKDVSVARELLQVPNNAVRKACTELISRLGLQHHDAKYLLIHDIEMLHSPRARKNCIKKLKTYSKLSPDLKSLLQNNISILKAPLVKVVDRAQKLKENKLATIPHNVFILSEQDFSKCLKLKIEPFS